MGGIATLFGMLLSEDPADLVNVAFQDLFNMGLQNTEKGGGTMSKHGIVAKRSTEFEDRYLRYITMPKE